MGGGELRECRVGANGIAGDRAWALRDEAAGEMRGGKKFPVLLQCRARYVQEPSAERSANAEITLPDGGRVRTDDPGVSERLSALCGTRVTLHPLRSADDRDFHRRRLPSEHAERKHWLREALGRLPDEPLPDLSRFARLDLTSRVAVP
jgi:hypothetical protein